MNIPETLSIELFGLTILEPSVTGTDLIVTAVCFYAFFKIKKSTKNDKVSFYFKWFFFTMGIATIIGGILGHAFIYAVNDKWKLTSWFASMISISILERVSIEHARNMLKPKFVLFLEIINIIKLLIFIIIVAIKNNFSLSSIHMAIGVLAIVAPLEIFIYFKTKEKAVLLFLFSVAISVISIMIFILKIGIHKWLNHKALSHVVLSICMYLLFITACKLRTCREIT